MIFINLEKIKSGKSKTCYDVLFVSDKDNSTQVGFLYYHNGVLSVLVDDEVFTEGRVILLEPYCGLYKKLLFNCFKVIV